MSPSIQLCLIGYTDRRSGFRRIHHLSMQDVCRVGQSSLEEKASSGPDYQIYLGDRLVLEGSNSLRLAVCPLPSGFHRNPCLLWFTSGRRDSSRGLPFAVSLRPCGLTCGSRSFLSSLKAIDFPSGMKMKHLFPSCGLLLFPVVPQTPFILGLPSRPGGFLGGGFP